MFKSSTWCGLLPLESWEDDGLQAIGEDLASGEAGRLLDAALADQRYPDEALQRLGALGIWRFFADDGADPRWSSLWHVSSLNALCSRRSASLAISVGINGLALLPLYIAGTPEQKRHWTGIFLRGARAAMGLSEWERGSDLARNEACAVREGNQYVLTGEKRPINQAGHAGIITVLARTGEADPDSLLGPSAGMSVFMLEPDASVRRLERVLTLPATAADISGFALEGTRVPESARIGAEGEGFSLVQRALGLSRGGISAFAAGTSELARRLAAEHLLARRLYGKPIAALGAIAEHQRRAAAFELAVHCMSIKATALANAFGQGASYYSAVAKFICCELGEHCVDEGRHILSARALIRGPFETLVRDSILFGSFDGTRHVVLDGMKHRLHQALCGRRRAGSLVAEVLSALRTAPQPTAEVVAGQRRPLIASPFAHASELAEEGGAIGIDGLVASSAAVEGIVRALAEGAQWGRQFVAFEALEAICRLEAAIAVSELADPGRRQKRSLPAPAPVLCDETGFKTAPVARYAISFLAAGAVARCLPLAALVADESLLSNAIGALTRCEAERDAAREDLSTANRG